MCVSAISPRMASSIEYVVWPHSHRPVFVLNTILRRISMISNVAPFKSAIWSLMSNDLWEARGLTDLQTLIRSMRPRRRITWSLWGSWRKRWCRESCTWWGRSCVAEPLKRSPVSHLHLLGSVVLQRNLGDRWTGAMSRRQRVSQQPRVRFQTGCCHSP